MRLLSPVTLTGGHVDRLDALTVVVLEPAPWRLFPRQLEARDDIELA